MGRFIKVGEAQVNVDRLLFVEPTRIAAEKEPSHARLISDNGTETITPLNVGKTAGDILTELFAEEKQPV